MRDHSNHIELSKDQAVSRIVELLAGRRFHEQFAHAPEQVAVSEAYGRVLAEDVFAKVDVPSALTCCLDSVAVHWSAFEGLPDGGVPDTSAWVRGRDWEFANTGVAMPEGFDTAVVVEHVTVSDDEQHVEVLTAPSKQFAGTRPAGSTMHAGDQVVAAGTLVTPDVAAQIAGAGHSSVLVLRRPRVAFLPTGDELVPPNLPYSSAAPQRFAGKGHVFESNSAVVRGKVEAWGGTFVPFDIVADERDAIEQALSRAAQVADVIVLNAGSSKGSDDWSVEVVDEMGEIVCHQTNHGPGHHSSYAVLDCEGRAVPVVGISGPSGGASFTLDFYLRPVMFALLGLDPEPRLLPCRLQGEFPAGGPGPHAHGKKLHGEDRPFEATEPGSRFYSVRFMEVRADEEGVLRAKPVPGRPGSPATMHANAIYMMASGVGDVPPKDGDVINVELRFGHSL